MATGRVRSGVGETVTTSYLVGAGLVAAATYLFVGLTGTPVVAGPYSGRYVELLLLGVPAVGLIVAGFWLQLADFAAHQVYRIGLTAVAGTVIAALATGGILLVDTGPSLATRSTFALLVATGTEGSLIGVIAGTVTVAVQQVRRERAAIAELERLHALLRHNLRNRLTVLDGHLTLLAEEVGTYDESTMATIEAQVDGIESLLEQTRVAADVVGTSPGLAAVDLVGVVQEQRRLLEASYQAVTIETDLPERAPVIADDLVGTAVENVLTNAVIHHDGSAPGIEVRVAVDRDAVRLRIADDGPGIPPERRAAVLEAGTGEGTGMGLYLAETVLERYGGSIAVDDNEPRGTVVTLTFRRAAE